MGTGKHILQKHRITFTRILGALVVLLALFTAPSLELGTPGHMAVDLASFVLVLVAAFGRLWALAYISGNKTMNLITIGPYSMARNPLYLFSLIGALGLGLYTLNPLVLALIAATFSLYYPFVIRKEEQRLMEVHGRAFEEYRQRTPMFLPRFSLFRDEPYHTIDTRLFRRSFFSVMWFPLIYFLLYLVEFLRTAGVLPVLLTIP
ncbi:MAG TPA: isoprenylcysteine carboxylmethyltransferase family protein [Deltaproteobacteria bacterium]|jgi:protein-S-isoprenylcysteine O-methyltransferase Ste14|nr:isoprenylcysteine carboxylmethyltransferase family protein [Deltaproteobacteria bacterium]HOI07917.1 isoprenylcysteine carboxylmethyltransferase family protein [Deltaproteobacteria bacterium]